MNSKKVKPLPLVAIVGPTASGKTDLALKLAKKFNGLIISADSRQIYQHARLGTNQPAGKWQMANGKWQKIFNQKKLYFVKNIPHFFIDFISPRLTYSAAQFQKAVNRLLKQISIYNYLPILVGGTGLYISAITQNYTFPTSKANLALRKKLEKLNTTALLNKLKKLDEKTYNAIDKKNKRRIIRALEHVILTGESFYTSQKQQTRPNTLILGINIGKKTLRRNIAKRTANMVKLGLSKEAQYLKKNYPHSTLLKTIGYKEILQVSNNKAELIKAVNLINTHTWQYAKRQLTWFKKTPGINWINSPTQAKLHTKNLE